MTLALVAGRAEDFSFIQVITDEESYIIRYPLSAFEESWPARIGGNAFGYDGISINIHNPDIRLSGHIAYGSLTPIAYDIMGPFRYFPMECRHGVLSMAHTLCGSVALTAGE